MKLGYLLIGVILGLVTFISALFLGLPFWLSYALYAFSGSALLIFLPLSQSAFAGMIVTPMARNIICRLTGRATPQADADHHTASDPTQHPAPFHQPTPVHSLERNAQAVFTILAVDDDPFILDLVDTIGASAGAFDIILASSGAEALDLLASTNKTFDYLLFDISMPQMSGIDLCRRVRRMPRYQDVPLVMLTALRDMDHIAEAFQAGATDYATKPFDIEALRNRLQAAHAAFKAQTEVAQTAGGLWQARTTDSRLDHVALSHYMTVLPEKDVAVIQVFAIKIEPMEALRALYAPARLASLLDDVAATVTDALDARQTVMAYTKDNDLVIATSTTALLDLAGLEARVAQSVQAFDPRTDHGDSLPLGVSVGDPVPLQGPRTQRARLAIDRAVELAEDRALSKHKSLVTYMPRVIGS